MPTVVLAQVLYEQGALSEVEALARDRLPLVTVRASPETAVRVYPLLARIAAHRRQVGLALFLLGEGEALGEARGWGRLTAACLQQRVELLVRGRRIEEAQTSLERMRPLFNAANRSHYTGTAMRERRFLQPYVGSLLNSWRRAHELAGALKISKLSGPLSARECTILSLVRRGYSNKRVALELRIAPETVKSHAKHIFLKLGARTRVDAVSRAASLGLI